MINDRLAFEECSLMQGSDFTRNPGDTDKYQDGNVQDDWDLWQEAIKSMDRDCNTCAHSETAWYNEPCNSCAARSNDSWKPIEKMP